MAIPILIDEILGRRFSERTEPLGTIWRHPDKVTGLYGIPVIAQTVYAFAGQHQKSVLHHVNFYHGERCSGLIRHRVYRHVEARIVGQESSHFKPGIAKKRLSRDVALTADEKARFGTAVGLIGLL